MGQSNSREVGNAIVGHNIFSIYVQPELIFFILKGTELLQPMALNGYVRRVISIASYNLLSQTVMERTNFLYMHLGRKPADVATWPRRSRLLADEFERLNSDLFALQEVDAEHYEQFYRPFFEQSE